MPSGAPGLCWMYFGPKNFAAAGDQRNLAGEVHVLAPR